MTLAPRRLAPLVALAVASAFLVATRGDGRPEKGDEEVFVQAAYIMRTQHVRALEGVSQAAEHEYRWYDQAARARDKGDIQTYALLPLWRQVSDFRVRPSPWGSPLYVESRTLSRLSLLWFLVAVFALYWAVLPLGRGVALAAALLLALGHPFRHGPALFDPWVMPLAAAAIGCWLRDRHRAAAALAVAAVMIKPNYLFLLPAFALAALVRPGRGDPDGRAGLPTAAVHGLAVAGVVAAYLVLGAVHLIYVHGYEQGVRSGYSPDVLAYSLLETASFTYRAANQQVRSHWPVFPWTVLNVTALSILAARAWRRVRVPRTTALLAGLVVIPALANFTVIHSVHDYQAGGHFRWINVSIMGMAVALPLAFRETARLLTGGRRRATVAETPPQAVLAR